ncbi:MAG: RteC domain-containing protein [Mucilaginibacter sp.]|nr:RteC domain-containing protein [Mucilaginibacter sp.]
MIDQQIDKLYNAMDASLSEATINQQSQVEQYRESILICKEAMNKLKMLITMHQFIDQEEEIRFFREQKPKFYSKYIYFISVYNFLMQQPAGGEESYRSYIQFHLSDLQRFFNWNKAFYQYYRSGSRHLDHLYFTRGSFDVHMELEDFEEDEQYSTSHDYKLSKLMANERFGEFLQLELAKHQMHENGSPANQELFPFSHPAWTAGQIDAVELIYALKASGAVNNGNIDIAELTAIFEFVFQFQIRDAYHTFTDIGNRKKETSVFLKKLSDSLYRWIEDKIAS